MIRQFQFGLVVYSLVWCSAACHDSTKRQAEVSPSVPIASNSSFPGYDSPPLAELLKAVGTSVTPSPEATPYNPRKVDVAPLQPAPVELLPVSSAGEPILLENAGAGLTIDPTLSDPITASAACVELVTSCVQPPSEPNARDRDSCFDSAPSCKSNHPWDEPQACCPTACKELYVELRKQRYRDWEAWGLVRGSDCFPGMQEFMKAAEDKDAKGAKP